MFYRSIASKYANIRAFEKPNEGAPGAEAAATTETKTDTPPAADTSVEDAKAAAAGSTDPKLKEVAAEKAELLREVMDKKAKLKKTETDLAAAQEALKAYEGIDPAKVRELLRKELDAERAAAEAKGDFERVKAMMVEEHEREKARIKQELDAEKTARSGDLALIDELTIGNSFGNSEFIRESLTISPVKARRLYGDHFERQGGVVVAYDKPAGAANRTMLVDARGEPLPFDEALNRIVDADPDKKGVLRSKAKPGAASATEPGKAKPDTPKLTGKSLIAASIKDL